MTFTRNSLKSPSFPEIQGAGDPSRIQKEKQEIILVINSCQSGQIQDMLMGFFKPFFEVEEATPFQPIPNPSPNPTPTPRQPAPTRLRPFQPSPWPNVKNSLENPSMYPR